MIDRMKANTARLGGGSIGRGVAVLVAGCVVVFIAAGVFLNQPTVAVGLCIGWVVGLLAFGLGPAEPGDPAGPADPADGA